MAKRVLARKKASGSEDAGFDEKTRDFDRDLDAEDYDLEDEFSDEDFLDDELEEDEDDGFDPYEDLVVTDNNEAAFTAADARQRSGNYVIPFGLPGSGKTTFLASLFKYLDESPDLDSDIEIAERRGVPNYAGQAMLNEWRNIFNKGRFLHATAVGVQNVRELSYKVMPTVGRKRPLTFSVVEISGEDLYSVIATSAKDPVMPPAIEAIFQNRRIRPIIVLIIHPKQQENDLLFGNLFTWLKRNVGPRMNSFSLAIVIADPKRATKSLHKYVESTRMKADMDVPMARLYVEKFAPKTYSVYKSWSKSKRAIIPFYVGDVEIMHDGKEEYERIKVFKRRHVRMAFQWIYLQFTGKRLGQTLWQRFFKSATRGDR